MATAFPLGAEGGGIVVIRGGAQGEARGLSIAAGVDEGGDLDATDEAWGIDEVVAIGGGCVFGGVVFWEEVPDGEASVAGEVGVRDEAVEEAESFLGGEVIGLIGDALSADIALLEEVGGAEEG